MFTKALLAATYKDGNPSRGMTDAHMKAEHHRFKKEGLFKETIISQELYVARLVQQFVIIKEIEAQLKSLPPNSKNEIDSFFALSYINELWRTSGMEQDLKLLDEKNSSLDKQQIMPSTQNYLANIKKLTPKALLAHFLMHVAGFMHGGVTLQNKYLEPSNQLTKLYESGAYEIPANQYDFSAAIKKLPEIGGNQNLFRSMMTEVDKISLDVHEYDDVAKQCNEIFETMTAIYDDLCDKYLPQPKVNLAIVILATFLITLALLLKQMSNSKDFHTGSNPYI
ncbi:MAG: biliverdin-producing heme oxygenase [Proteobacteria bacterium]|nr:biliverdin-producing heme oxygenase [Pseudomonadota bacterium]